MTKQKVVEIEGRRFFLKKWKNGKVVTQDGFYEGHYLIKDGMAYAGGNSYPMKYVDIKDCKIKQLTYKDLRRELIGCS